MTKAVAKPKANGTQQTGATVEQMLAKIRQHQKKLATNEGSVVEQIIQIGLSVWRLREVTEQGDWAKRLNEVGINDRVALRYKNIGKAWGDENRLVESDLLGKVPTDLLKLEWLCKLDNDSLEKLVNDKDCKQLKRSEVRDAVVDLLPEEEKPKARAQTASQSPRVKSVMEVITSLKKAKADENVWKEIEKVVKAKLDEVQKTNKAVEKNKEK